MKKQNTRLDYVKLLSAWLIILAKLNPENSQFDKPQYFIKIFRHSIYQAFDFSYGPKDFSNLSKSDSSNCQNCNDLKANKNTYFQVVTGLYHACAINKLGKVNCWGNNSYGQLGDDSYNPRYAPIEVHLNAEAKAISSGDYHTCALTRSEEVYCWGSNEYGQLGSADLRDSALPVKITGLDSAVRQISSGSNHNCVELANQTLKCWGSNSSYQLGNNLKINSYLPVNVMTSHLGGVFVMPLKSLSAGKDHNCLIDNNGRAFCWGGISGCVEKLMQKIPTQPTDGSCSGSNSLFPLVISSNSNLSNLFSRNTWRQVVTNGKVNYAINSNVNSEIYCWGQKIGDPKLLESGCASYDQNVNSYASSDISNVTKLSLSEANACAIKKILPTTSSGMVSISLHCWGKNYQTGLIQESPLTVTEVKAPIDISVSSKFSCAIDFDGFVWCWGQNKYGQLGSGNLVNSFEPKKIQDSN